MRDDGREPDGPGGAAPYPKAVAVAGVAWIAAGGLLVFVVVANFVVVAADAGINKPPLAKGGLPLVFGCLVAGVFIRAGQQSTHGLAPGTARYGLGSLALGLLIAPLGALLVNPAGAVDPIGVARSVLGGGTLLSGLGLLLAGTSALIGSGGYQAWLRAQTPTPRGDS